MLFLIISIFVFLTFVMEVGAIELKITGMEISNARFQALSALTGTGFTTKDSETILNNRIRKRIIMTLMIIGHIGLTVIVISAVTLSRAITLWQLIAGFTLIFVAYLFASNAPLLNNLDKGIESQLIKNLRLRKKPVEEVLHLNDQYSVAEVELNNDCVILNKSLASLQLTKRDILVLAIKGDNRLILTPTGNDIIKRGDTLVVYGKLKNIENIVNCDIIE